MLALAVSGCGMLQPKGMETTNWLGKKVVNYSVEQNGVFTAERKEETMLSLKATTHPFPKTMYNPETIVIVAEYNVKGDEKGEGKMREDIHFEIPSKPFSKTYVGADLDEVKLIYGKHCYCPELAGYTRIDNGKLRVKHKEKTTYVELTFVDTKTNEKKFYHFSVEK